MWKYALHWITAGSIIIFLICLPRLCSHWRQYNKHPDRVEKVSIHTVIVSKEIRPFIEEFLLECKKNKIEYSNFLKLDSVTFSKLGYPLGRCSCTWIKSHGHDKCDIILNQRIKNSDIVKLITFHELGHCILKKKHVCDRLSIMNPYIKFEASEYNKYYENWNSLSKNLFLENEPICTHEQMLKYQIDILNLEECIN